MKTFQLVSKDLFRQELQRHFDMDAIIQGSYADGGPNTFKGCMMGCAAQSIMNVDPQISIIHSDHSAQSDLLGLPL